MFLALRRLRLCTGPILKPDEKVVYIQFNLLLYLYIWHDICWFCVPTNQSTTKWTKLKTTKDNRESTWCEWDRCEESHLFNKVGSTSESPAAGLTNNEPNFCRCPASNAWLMSATADSISTATNSSSCCSSPWWTQTGWNDNLTEDWGCVSLCFPTRWQQRELEVSEQTGEPGVSVPGESASAAAAALGGKERQRMETLEAAEGLRPSDSWLCVWGHWDAATHSHSAPPHALNTHTDVAYSISISWLFDFAVSVLLLTHQ